VYLSSNVTKVAPMLIPVGYRGLNVLDWGFRKNALNVRARREIVPTASEVEDALIELLEPEDPEDDDLTFDARENYESCEDRQPRVEPAVDLPDAPEAEAKMEWDVRRQLVRDLEVKMFPRRAVRNLRRRNAGRQPRTDRSRTTIRALLAA